MKPEKPYHGFPLTAHPNGQWSKKIHGKVYYFGTWDDWAAALAKFTADRDYLYLGQAPPTTATTVADILNEFLENREVARDAGDLAERSYNEYDAVCQVIADTLGKARPVEGISNNDLGRLRGVLGKGKENQQLAPSSVKRLLTIARMVFKYANNELGCNVRYANALKAPAARAIRQRRNEVGERLFSPDELQALVKAAKPQLKAMILLGINCGFGNADCATLPISAVDLAGGWHNYWRPKTHIQRRCPLWPETREALAKVIGDRQGMPVFITKYGNQWLGEGRADPISYEFRKLVKSLGIYRKDVTTFYTLRRTLETIASTADVNQSVIDSIMGHAPAANNMAAIYRQRVFDDSLRKCTDYMRKWYRGKIKIA